MRCDATLQHYSRLPIHPIMECFPSKLLRWTKFYLLVPMETTRFSSNGEISGAAWGAWGVQIGLCILWHCTKFVLKSSLVWLFKPSVWCWILQFLPKPVFAFCWLWKDGRLFFFEPGQVYCGHLSQLQYYAQIRCKWSQSVIAIDPGRCVESTQWWRAQNSEWACIISFHGIQLLCYTYFYLF